jgi:hypothetical protein
MTPQRRCGFNHSAARAGAPVCRVRTTATRRPDGDGTEQCPACAQIDTLKAIPPNVTTFAPGSGFAVTSK